MLAVDNLNGVKVLRQLIRVDHVHTYKLPKDLEKLDQDKKKLFMEGCAPKPISADEESSEEDDLLQMEELPVKAKKEKKKKKDKKHKKKKKRAERSESEEDEEDEDQERGKAENRVSARDFFRQERTEEKNGERKRERSSEKREKSSERRRSRDRRRSRERRRRSSSPSPRRERSRDRRRRSRS